ncbi:helicase-related protein [Pseudomonas sp. LB3P81]
MGQFSISADNPEGTERIFDYFGGIVGPVITLSDAIKARRLVPYRYYPHFVSLNEDERGRWRELTLKLKKLYAFSQRDGAGKPVDTLRSRLLKIQRSWIPKKAARKVDVTQSILRKCYETGQHWLIYCEDSNQLADVAEACKTIGINPLVYHSAMNGEAPATLSYFVQFGGVLISIRCLDEGIDIPIISHAIILASSQNPRQFIQRRGRVLRQHESKTLAEIHDVLVIPIDPEADEQDSLTLSEFKRAIEFADDAINQTEASVLREKAVELGLLLSDIYEMGTEDETDDDSEVPN